MDAIFGLAGDDFVIICADKTHCRSIVKMDVSQQHSKKKGRRALARATRLLA
jgi:20S proteasome alpha/beta subunit